MRVLRRRQTRICAPDVGRAPASGGGMSIDRERKAPVERLMFAAFCLTITLLLVIAVIGLRGRFNSDAVLHLVGWSGLAIAAFLAATYSRLDWLMANQPQERFNDK